MGLSLSASDKKELVALLDHLQYIVGERDRLLIAHLIDDLLRRETFGPLSLDAKVEEIRQHIHQQESITELSNLVSQLGTLSVSAATRILTLTRTNSPQRSGYKPVVVGDNGLPVPGS